MPEVQWYYARNNEQFGPVSAGELKQLAEARQLSPDDVLWREGMEAWTTAASLRGLFAETPSADTPMPPAATAVTAERASRTAAERASMSAQPAGLSLDTVLRTTQTALW